MCQIFFCFWGMWLCQGVCYICVPSNCVIITFFVFTSYPFCPLYIYIYIYIYIYMCVCVCASVCVCVCVCVCASVCSWILICCELHRVTPQDKSESSVCDLSNRPWRTLPMRCTRTWWWPHLMSVCFVPGPAALFLTTTTNCMQVCGCVSVLVSVHGWH